MPRPNRGPRCEPNSRGIYEVRWTEHGRSKRVSSGTADPVAAADFFKAWRQQLDAEREEAAASTVRGVLAAYFAEHVRVAAAAQGTAEIARRHLEAHFGDMAPAAIRPAEVRAYQRQRAAGRIGRPAASATVRRELVVLVAALNHAVREGRLARGAVPAIPLPADSDPRVDWLTDEEVEALFRAAAQDRPGGRLSRVERWLFLAYHTGRRTEAIERLTWDRVDFTLGLIDFDEPGRARTKKRRGICPMNRALRETLERARREAGDEAEYVLDQPGRIRKALATLGRRAGVPRVHPHLLKHTCITHMLRRGVRVWDVAGAVATSAATIERVYGKHTREATKAVMEVLA